MATILASLTSVGPLLGLGAADLRRVGIFVLCLVAAIAIHEFAHAWMANRLGDPTPKQQGRLTLNPMAHADPVGTLLLPVVLALMAPGMLFGWGRPVQTEPRYYTRKITMRAGMALVSFAGPLSNLLLAVLTAVAIAIGVRTGVLVHLSPQHPLLIFYDLNAILFAFNLIPIHPLDGGKILAWMLGPKRQHIDDFLTRYGQWILLGLIALPPGRMILGLLLSPVLSAASWLLRALLSIS